jgi:hypothetical protein
MVFFNLLSHSLENTQPSTHKHEDMNLDIIYKKSSNLDKINKYATSSHKWKKGKIFTRYHEEWETYNLTNKNDIAMLHNRKWTYVEVTTIWGGQ